MAGIKIIVVVTLLNLQWRANQRQVALQVFGGIPQNHSACGYLKIMVEFKNRYMVMEVFLDPNRGIRVDDPIELTKNNVMEAIGNSIRVTARDFSLHLSLKSFKVKYVNPITKICIIRASREDHREVWQAITLITRIKDYPVIFNLLKLTGKFRSFKQNIFEIAPL
ncbi:hypothetical protein CRG98_044062 [Punica granatum]|uniref:Uncharacterized protein n=1 Tax=Punica granatum TaxID=22663 RepID=A0A2I0HV97_PUNGR|nr:hypothetical protein CRG98_044062 [Punica granatum]